MPAFDAAPVFLCVEVFKIAVSQIEKKEPNFHSYDEYSWRKIIHILKSPELEIWIEKKVYATIATANDV